MSSFAHSPDYLLCSLQMMHSNASDICILTYSTSSLGDVQKNQDFSACVKEAYLSLCLPSESLLLLVTKAQKKGLCKAASCDKAKNYYDLMTAHSRHILRQIHLRSTGAEQ